MRRFGFFCVALLLLLLASCGPTPSPPSGAGQNAAAIDTTFPLTLTDDLDRQVPLDDKPQRIVSLLPSNTEILFAVGAGKQVVGVTSYCNYPPEATKREQVGGITNKSISIEAVVALEPNLVLASGSHNEIIPILEEAGLTVLVLEPATFEDIFANIQMVGRATGHFDQAQNLTTDLQRRVQTVTTTVAEIPAEERPKVFYEVWDDPLMTAGPNTFIGQLIELAGGQNIFSDVGEDWPQVSSEVVIERNPEFILGPESHADALIAETIVDRTGWETISAVQNNQITLLNPDAVSRSGPRIVDMLEEIARELHPDLF